MILIVNFLLLNFGHMGYFGCAVSSVLSRFVLVITIIMFFTGKFYDSTYKYEGKAFHIIFFFFSLCI